MWPSWLGELFQLAAYSSVRAIFLAAAVGGLLAVMRVPRGGVRHAAWAAVVTAMLLLPVLTRVVPPIEVRLPAGVRAIDPLAEGVLRDWTSRTVLPADALPSSLVRETRVVPTVANTPVAPRVQSRALAMPDPVWPLVVIGAYALGVLFFLARLFVGWAMMRRLVRGSRPWGQPDANRAGIVICESSLVATPLTVGIVSPVIILPTAWSSWPEETLRAVLAHENAHVRRRDPLVALVAFVNRAIFWFHPLAWWLERAIVRSAEDACDGAAIREVTTPRRYAEVLMEMAEAVRRHKGRVAWQGVGVDGSGFLARRIVRILRGDVFREVSMARKIVISLVSILAIAIVVACQQPKPAPSPLEPDPQLIAQWAKEKTRAVEYKAMQAMTAKQVAELEARLQKNPDDGKTRGTLLDFYFYADIKHKVISWDDKVAGRRRHVLWLIAHDPGGLELKRGWRVISPVFDPKGYAEAKKLWLVATDKKDVALPVLRNAANFYQDTDELLVEGLLLRAEAMDPGGPKPREKDGVYYIPWSAWLGSLYVGSIVDAAKGVKGPVENPSKVTDADRAFATSARRKLSDSTNVTMLVGAGGMLTEQAWFRSGSVGRRDPVDSELQQLGVSYLNRAVQLDPSKTTARSYLARFAQMQRGLRLWAALKDVPIEKQREVIAAWPEADRLFGLEMYADGLRWKAESTVTLKKDPAGAKGVSIGSDPAGARALWTQAKAAAEDVLKLAESQQGVPDRGVAILSTRLTLSALALDDNDLASALKHMEAAGNVPICDELKYGRGPYWTSLATRMLKWGERESVARFLDRLAAISESERERLKKDAAKIRAGKMPEFYQYQTVPH